MTVTGDLQAYVPGRVPRREESRAEHRRAEAGVQALPTAEQPTCMKDGKGKCIHLLLTPVATGSL